LLYTAPPPSDVYTLSLHDALPIFFTDAVVPGELWVVWLVDDADDAAFAVAILRDGLANVFAAGVADGCRKFSGLGGSSFGGNLRSEEHTSELQSLAYLVCRLLLEK